METKHTPGPWSVKKYINYIGYSVWADDRGCIAERWYDKEQGQPYGDEIEANARLIAAAPDLLEACKAANNQMNIHFGITDEDEGGNHIHDKIMQAIAKAEGK